MRESIERFTGGKVVTTKFAILDSGTLLSVWLIFLLQLDCLPYSSALFLKLLRTERDFVLLRLEDDLLGAIFVQARNLRCFGLCCCGQLKFAFR